MRRHWILAATAFTGTLATALVAHTAAPGVLTGKDALGDWTTDKPGVTRKIAAGDIPKPNQAESVRNNSIVDDRPANAKLSVPAGFAVTEFFDDLDGPRTIRTAPNGDIFVAESRIGRVRVLRPSADGAKPASVETFAEGLTNAFGIAFYPAANPQWIYIGETNRVVRYPYKAGDMKAGGPPDIIVGKIAETVGGHTTRDIAFTKDGSRMLVSVGSQSNVAEGMMDKKPTADLVSWEKDNGLGGSWGKEAGRASVISFTPDGKDRKAFANGIRNCVGLNQNPATGDIYCSTNERDTLGNNLVPDYLTRVQDGHFYGWPWYYMGDNEDPRLAGQRPDLKGKVTVPDVLFQSHSAALQTTFYPADIKGASAFPAEYRGDAFVALHGSWNRAPRTGYKVVRVKLDKGVPTGEYQDFLTGFVIDQEKVWGRPVGVAVMKDGSLLVSEDGNSTIWRVAYTGK
jgi:glucose/arabinose dehydrogenase